MVIGMVKESIPLVLAISLLVNTETEIQIVKVILFSKMEISMSVFINTEIGPGKASITKQMEL